MKAYNWSFSADHFHQYKINFFRDWNDVLAWDDDNSGRPKSDAPKIDAFLETSQNFGKIWKNFAGKKHPFENVLEIGK